MKLMPGLTENFRRYIKKYNLFADDSHILLAISGGIDSMVMADLFGRLPNPLSIAHCNFMLRGDESDQDEEFVRQYAISLDIPLFVKRFDTSAFADKHHISIQMAARKMRYDWFNRLAEENRMDVIAVAHNMDDLVETFLINLSRGTGLRGLTGIRPKQGKIIRPLLFATREEITAWATRKNIAFREDSSNQMIKYVRNKIRHEIIPLFREINPGFLPSVAETTIRLQGIDRFFSNYVQTNLAGYLQKFGDRFVIPIAKLRESEAAEAVLFELLRPFRFPPAVTFKIMESLDSEPGKKFFSPSHRLIKDREHLIITAIPERGHTEKYYIEEGNTQLTHPVILHLESFEKQPGFQIPSDRNIAVLDRDRLQFPLILRKWREGDWFIPLGLGGIKKLSDFFVDRKLSLDEKEQVWLLTQGDEIIWVIGMQIDDRFKITENTRKVLRVEYLP
ncbi:MAG: tRNA lysidine(34) synthetase TilS [Chlorobi bacterium]|nr:tRNA lysidine(34) synthetase TilS [Chlorobiota bacterium]